MRRRRPEFDIYVAIDWSAHSKPKQGKDSLWIATSEGIWVNPPTRHEAFQWVLRHLCEWGERGARVLIGWDFPFGLPWGGCALVLGRRRALWRDLWAFLNLHVKDDERNGNNRFRVAQDFNRLAGGGGPFWGWQGKASFRGVPVRKPLFPFRGVAEFRECDLWVRRLHQWVSSPFQMSGAGAVGSQMIMGIPYVYRLRQFPAFRQRSFIYPFEMGELEQALNEKGALVVHTEIFLPLSLSEQSLTPRDKDQVLSFVFRAEQAGKGGELSQVFHQISELPATVLKKVLREEGWTLVL